MNPPTLSDVLKIYASSASKYWFNVGDCQILSCTTTDTIQRGDLTIERTVINDFKMNGLNVVWLREVVLRIPRRDRIEIRGEARVKYEGAWEFTPDLIMARLGIKEPS